mgnify:CR=1 FL=1
MKNLFDAADYQEIVRRMDALTPGAARQWGKMTPAQAMEHCARGLDLVLGPQPLKQMFIGKLIGWLVRGKFVGPEPFQKNAPTGPTLIVKDDPDFARAVTRAKDRLAAFHALGSNAADGRIHLFFGPLTGEEWGVTQYKHYDHHLRQFGA